MLYELPQKYEELMEKYDSFFDENGEQIVSDEEVENIQKEIEELQNKTEDSLEWYLKRRANKNARIKMLSEEIERMKKQVEQEKNSVERTENTIKRAVDTIYNGKPITISTFVLSYRKSEAVIVTDEEKVPNEYKNEKTTITVDKNRIKEAIKSGTQVSGASIETRSNLTIK